MAFVRGVFAITVVHYLDVMQIILTFDLVRCDKYGHGVQRKVGSWQWTLLRTMAWKNKEKS